MRKENVSDALTWHTGTDKNGKPSNFLYKDITIDHDLSQRYPVGGYSSEFDSDSNELSDLGSINSDENVYSKYTEMRSYLPASSNSNKEKVIINNEVISPKHMNLIRNTFFTYFFSRRKQ